ncbi:MAG: YcfL family protein [gamma proteobacterium symbiont of Bathyaustriella thionipta]|nr:YcfL family protein [gamma proteobacterium symbiont of Bathyaustriella thionipta]MCU7951016.1 YcfL family protein [gamma proteobacterium symbiont of Bathyaustriella thionipta]MCU7952101.1 YcfL family protein [gamma proteobacterium symbiont of Bathyaustriella thionipta]MCU7957796.1 YcfL family protein [gamma proteobacterium symbiont of Bathyaustriella thionipta]MCU7966152.1 YcfL family protein [gamma proteobacterium symbiont of Bathyaustriella thionipta]
MRLNRGSMYFNAFMLIAMAFSTAACKQVTVAENPNFLKQKTLDDTHPRARLVLGSEKLAGNIRMANIKFRKVGLFTQAQVGIQNLSDVRYNLEYKVEWEDASGFMLDQSGAWQRFTLAPTQIDTVTTTGKVPEAYKVVFTVRLPDDPFIINNKYNK